MHLPEIGKETAKLFSSRGWQVIATMRNPERGKDLEDLPNVVIMKLDISKPEDISLIKGLDLGHGIIVDFNDVEQVMNLANNLKNLKV